MGFEPSTGMPSNALERRDDVDAIRKYVSQNSTKNDATKKIAQEFEDWYASLSWFQQTLPGVAEWQEARRKRDALNTAMGTPTPYGENYFGPPKPPNPPPEPPQPLLGIPGLPDVKPIANVIRKSGYVIMIGGGLILILTGSYYALSAYYAIKYGKRIGARYLLGPKAGYLLNPKKEETE